MYFGCFGFGFRGELGFLNCDDVCMCVVNKHFELLKFVFDSVYVDLQYDMFSVVYVYLDHLKFCVVCIDGRRYVCCSECNALCNLCTLGVLVLVLGVSLVS